MKRDNHNNGKLIYRAGVIPCVYVNGVIEMCMMKPADPMYGGDKIQIAKGKIEDGEGTMEAALREAHEELGLLESNILQLWHLGRFLGRTDVFVAHVKNKDDFDMHTDETEHIQWVTLDYFIKNGRPLHVDIVKWAHDLFEGKCY